MLSADTHGRSVIFIPCLDPESQRGRWINNDKQYLFTGIELRLRAGHCAKGSYVYLYSSVQVRDLGIIIIPILCWRKLRLRERNIPRPCSGHEPTADEQHVTKTSCGFLSVWAWRHLSLHSMFLALAADLDQCTEKKGQGMAEKCCGTGDMKWKHAKRKQADCRTL